MINSLFPTVLGTPYGDGDLCNIGSGNGLQPVGTKPLPKPMLSELGVDMSSRLDWIGFV